MRQASKDEDYAEAARVKLERDTAKETALRTLLEIELKFICLSQQVKSSLPSADGLKSALVESSSSSADGLSSMSTFKQRLVLNCKEENHALIALAGSESSPLFNPSSPTFIT
jgi:hypothetical protein